MRFNARAGFFIAICEEDSLLPVIPALAAMAPQRPHFAASRDQFQVTTHHEAERYVDPETWRKSVPVKKCSWWPEWQTWLEQNSNGQSPPPVMGAPEQGIKPLMDAPGSYVLMD